MEVAVDTETATLEMSSLVRRINSYMKRNTFGVDQEGSSAGDVNDALLGSYGQAIPGAVLCEAGIIVRGGSKLQGKVKVHKFQYDGVLRQVHLKPVAERVPWSSLEDDG